jgi:hypothetical protein
MRRITSGDLTALFAALLAGLLAACASTSLVNQWKSPDYTAGPMRKVMVVGVAKQPSVRRVFEDEFVAKLKAAGVEGIPSYTVINEEGQADQGRLEAAVEKVGAEGVLVTRLVKKERDTQVAGGYPGPVAPMGMYGWYSSAWTGYYEPATVYQYDVLTLETSLYSPKQSKLVWSGTTETFDPTDVKQETAAFADLIIGTLRKEKII